MTTREKKSKQKYLSDEYTFRINRVIDYIERNIDKELLLEDLARIAHFSRFHFHRIFRAMMGETLNQYIQRTRIEKAANQLINNPKKSITHIAFDCGFSGSATFARLFREIYDMNASEWRAGGYQQHRKICKTESKRGQPHSRIRKDILNSSIYIDDNQNMIWRFEMINKEEIKVEVKDVPEFHVAYIRHIGPYQGDSDLFEKLFNKLFMWAGPRGLLRFPETRVLSIYHDNPEITDDNRLRTSVCISVPDDTPVDGEIGKMVISDGKYAFARFEIHSEEYQDAWDFVYGCWLPESGYQPDDRPCYELYHNNPQEHPEKKHIVDICIPVMPM
ncbi:MAG: AraC family transcriptional regulator [Spirochaetota bacterium]|nr:AraC family transcriptional regulator [Spirochaetota bacterium]